MKTDIGEYLVGAYLRLIEECDFVDYNVRPPGGGLEGLHELDVVGFDFKKKTVYLCEVTTHIRGLLISKNKKDQTVTSIKGKYERQQAYAKQYLGNFPKYRFQFWSPVVRPRTASELGKIQGLELVINGEYADRVNRLIELAKTKSHDARNPVFRVFQILASLKGRTERES